MYRLLFSLLLLYTQGFAQLSMTFPPGVPASNELAQLGFLDVTLYGADPTGSVDATAAIQQAINDARDYQFVCWFPSGVYLVSDTLTCVLPVKWNGINWFSDRRKPPTLMGATSPRPVLKLANFATGYGDTLNPKPMLWLWAGRRDPYPGATVGSNDPADEQAGIAFNMVVKGIDFDLNGHAGATGIKFSGAQGSTIEDVDINATGAYAGLHNTLGQGGGTYNVAVSGGRYGIFIDDPTNAQYALYTGCRFLDQEIAWLKFPDFFTQFVMVGFHIRANSGPVNHDLPYRGLSLIDGVLELTGAVSDHAFTHAANRNLYLKNVFIKGADSLAQELKASNPNDWTHIREYGWSRNYQSTHLIDGVANKDAFIELGTAAPDVDALLAKHLWDEASFPSIEDRFDSNFVNVKDGAKMAGAPAAGDGVQDDTEALQFALDNYPKVFLPKGIYKVSDPIVLRYASQLFGASKTIAIVRADTAWQPADRTAVVETIYHADATTSLSFLMIETDPEQHFMMNHLNWRVGRNSMVRDIMAGFSGFASYEPTPHVHHLFEVSHFGGGRWYAATAEWTKNKLISGHPAYRGFWANGTSQPLALYALNVERVDASPMAEVSNSQNIDFYFYKAESGDYAGGGSTLENSVCLQIRDSEDIAVFGCTGNINLAAGQGIIEIENSTDVTVTQLKAFNDGTDWFNLVENYDSTTTTVNALTHLSLYKRRAPGCAASGGLLANPISPTQVVLNWNSTSNALGYQLRGRPLGGGSFKSKPTTNSPISLSGLTGGQSYEWMLRTYCDDGSFSAFTPLDTFSMPMISANSLLVNPERASAASELAADPDFSTDAKLSIVAMGKVANFKSIGTAAIQSASIYDLSGNLLWTIEPSLGQFLLRADCSHFSSGVYLGKMKGTDASFKQALFWLP